MGLTAGTLVGVCEFPFLLTGTAVTLSGAEAVQERPVLSRESKTWLSDCGVIREVGIDHRGRLAGFSPLTVDCRRSRSNWSDSPSSSSSISRLCCYRFSLVFACATGDVHIVEPAESII